MQISALVNAIGAVLVLYYCYLVLLEVGSLLENLQGTFKEPLEDPPEDPPRGSP